MLGGWEVLQVPGLLLCGGEAVGEGDVFTQGL